MSIVMYASLALTDFYTGSIFLSGLDPYNLATLFQLAHTLIKVQLSIWFPGCKSTRHWLRSRIGRSTHTHSDRNTQFLYECNT